MNTEQIMALALNYAITLGKFKECNSDANKVFTKADKDLLRSAIEALVQERDEAIRECHANAQTFHDAIKIVADDRDALKASRDEYQQAADKLAAENKVLRDALNEINSWLVCSCIATPEDMAQQDQSALKPADVELYPQVEYTSMDGSCECLFEVIKEAKHMLERDHIDSEKLKVIEMCERAIEAFNNTTPPAAPAQQEPVAKAWAEGYRAGVEDERTSEDNIGIAGFGMKVEPARENPYCTPAAPAQQAVPSIEQAEKNAPVGRFIRRGGPGTSSESIGLVALAKLPPDGALLYTHPAAQQPLADEQKLDLVTNWFAEDWAIKKALGLLADFEQAHGIKGASL